MHSPEPPLPPREALADVRVRAPTRGNRRLDQLLIKRGKGKDKTP
jgi:hypothetical protein